MIGASVSGFMYSHITGFGKERLIAASFGTSKTKAKQNLKTLNSTAKISPFAPHKRYAVQINVFQEIPQQEKQNEIP